MKSADSDCDDERDHNEAAMRDSEKDMSYEDMMREYEDNEAGTGWPDNSYDPKPNDVQFVQFLRPNRKRRLLWMSVPEDVKIKADILEHAGYRFECEELTTGKIHLDCSSDDEQLAASVVPNDDGMPQVVVRLIERAYSNHMKRTTG